MLLVRRPSCLKGEEDQEGHHEAKEPHSLRKGEAQDGVGKELLFQRGVSGVANHERAENRPNASSCRTKFTAVV